MEQDLPCATTHVQRYPPTLCQNVLGDCCLFEHTMQHLVTMFQQLPFHHVSSSSFRHAMHAKLCDRLLMLSSLYRTVCLRGLPANGFPGAATAGAQQGAGDHNQLNPEDEPVTDSDDDLDSVDDMDCEDGYEEDCEHECEDDDMAGDYSYDHTHAQEVGTCSLRHRCLEVVNAVSFSNSQLSYGKCTV